MGCCQASEGPINPNEVDLSHFTMLSTVGKGGFGKVKAAQDRKDPTPKYDDANDSSSIFYAMKLQDLRELIRKESHWRAAWVERTVMAKVTSPFVVKLHYAFVSSMDLVLVMPFLRGGDLNFYLENSGPMTESMARFYSSQILLGLEAIHKLNFVYRDLKPENCLLDAKGHLYISDLGLATLLQERDKRYNNELFSRRYPPPHHLRTRGCCGTPGYVAPEVINRHSYGFMPDFFTFGATIARMLMRRNPFDPKLMDRQRRNRGQKYVSKEDFPPPRLPAKVSKECRDFVHKLCAFYDEKRLGYKYFWKEVRRHPFYTKAPGGWDWKKIEDKKIKPPHTPSLQRLNFNPVYEAEEQIMAEGRKPLDKTEKDKVKTVFHDIGFNIQPPFKNSAGEVWPKPRSSSTVQKTSKAHVPDTSTSAVVEAKTKTKTKKREAKFDTLGVGGMGGNSQSQAVPIVSKAKGIDFEDMDSKKTGSPYTRSTAPSVVAIPSLGSRKNVRTGSRTPPMNPVNSVGAVSADVAREGSMSGKRESKTGPSSADTNPLAQEVNTDTNPLAPEVRVDDESRSNNVRPDVNHEKTTMDQKIESKTEKVEDNGKKDIAINDSKNNEVQVPIKIEGESTTNPENTGTTLEPAKGKNDAKAEVDTAVPKTEGKLESNSSPPKDQHQPNQIPASSKTMGKAIAVKIGVDQGNSKPEGAEEKDAFQEAKTEAEKVKDSTNEENTIDTIPRERSDVQLSIGGQSVGSPVSKRISNLNDTSALLLTGETGTSFDRLGSAAEKKSTFRSSAFTSNNKLRSPTSEERVLPRGADGPEFKEDITNSPDNRIRRTTSYAVD